MTKQEKVDKKTGEIKNVHTTIVRARKRTQTINTEPTMTEQHHKEACDINNILKKFQETGTLQNLNTTKPYYGDVSSYPEYREGLEQIREANEAFMNLPAQIRKQMNNDPANMIEFLEDKKNTELAIKYGLKKPPEKEKPPQKVEIIEKQEKQKDKT